MTDQGNEGLLVVGMVRSGTTLISRLVDAHPGAACPPDPFFGFFRLLRNRICADLNLDFDEDSPLSDYFLSDRAELDAMLKANLDLDLHHTVEDSIAEIRRFAEHNAPLLLEGLNKITTVHLGELYCQLLGVVQDRYGGEHCQRVGFKQTWVEALVPAIQNSFPDTRIVHVIRDPRSVIASWREADDLTHQYPFLMMIRHWRKSVGFASLGSVRNANYVVVRYEDFVAQPSVVADRIWDTCALARVSVDPQSFRDGKGQSWMTNTSYAKSDGITSSHVSSWEERLSEGEVKIIEHLCGPEMAWAGYEAVTDTMSLAPFLEQADLYRTKGKTEWISQYADAFALNGENMAKEAGRWLIAREIATLGEGVDSDLSRAMFLDPGILTRV